LGLLFTVGFLNVPGWWLCSFAGRALREHDPYTALLWIDRAARFSPSDSQVKLLAARAYLQLNMNLAAMEQVDKAAQHAAPADVLEPFRLIIAAQRGDWNASEELMNWSANSPLPIEAYEAIVRCAQINNKLDRAALILDQVEKSGDGKVMIDYQRGRNREILEDFAEAAKHFQKAYEAYPNSARAALRAGICLEKLKLFEDAETMFRKVQRGPYLTVAATELANCLWEQNRSEVAAETLERSLHVTPDELQTLYMQVDEFVDSDRAALVGARIQDALGNAGKSVELLRRVLAYNHRDFEARSLLIKGLRKLNLSSQADEVAKVQSEMTANRRRILDLRLELEQNPQNIEKLCELAELYWYTESSAEAQLVVSKILELDSHCVRAKELLAKMQFEQRSRSAPRP